MYSHEHAVENTTFGEGETPQGSAISEVAIKAVAKVLAHHANEKGICWPSVKTIARESGHSPATVKRVNAWLEDVGFFRVVRRTPLGGKSNRYMLREVITVDDKEVFKGSSQESVSQVHGELGGSSPRARGAGHGEPGVAHGEPQSTTNKPTRSKATKEAQPALPWKPKLKQREEEDEYVAWSDGTQSLILSALSPLWIGTIDPAWEIGNAVLTDKVPRMDGEYWVVPESLLWDKLGKDVQGINIPVPRPGKVVEILDRDPENAGKIRGYHEWQTFFGLCDWAFRRPQDDSILSDYERTCFDAREKREREPTAEEYRRVAWLMASGMDFSTAFEEVLGDGLYPEDEKHYLAGTLLPPEPYEVYGKPYFQPGVPLTVEKRRDLDALLATAVATKIEGPEWDRAFTEWQEKHPEGGGYSAPDADERKH